MLIDLYNSKNNNQHEQCKLSKKLLVVCTGLLNSSKVNGNILYNPNVYYIMIYISNIIIKSFVNYIKNICPNMVQYYSRTDSLFCKLNHDVDDDITINIIQNYVISQFKFI